MVEIKPPTKFYLHSFYRLCINISLNAKPLLLSCPRHFLYKLLQLNFIVNSHFSWIWNTRLVALAWNILFTAVRVSLISGQPVFERKKRQYSVVKIMTWEWHKNVQIGLHFKFIYWPAQKLAACGFLPFCSETAITSKHGEFMHINKS